MTDRNAICLRDVELPRGEAFKLSIPQLRIGPGEVHCLLGPVGAGKTSLLRLLAALETAAVGEVRYGEERLEGPSTPLSVRRRIVLLHQKPRLFRGTVIHNLLYPLRLRRIVPDIDQVREYLHRLGLATMAEARADSLSGGEIQKVALVRALIAQPNVLLLDEPTSHLDPANVARVESVVRDYHHERRPIIVWSTHNLFQARRMADRVTLLLDGRCIETADASTFFSNPRDPLARDFVQGRLVY